MPPSDATSQYPLPVGPDGTDVDEIDTTPGAGCNGPARALPTARPTLSAPLLNSDPVPGTASAVLISRAATCSALRPGLTAHTRAAAAETIGVANDVPSGVTQQFPSRHGVARVRTPTPGAAMSTHGPRRENLARVSSAPSMAATDSTPSKLAG